MVVLSLDFVVSPCRTCPIAMNWAQREEPTSRRSGPHSGRSGTSIRCVARSLNAVLLHILPFLSVMCREPALDLHSLQVGIRDASRFPIRREPAWGLHSLHITL